MTLNLFEKTLNAIIAVENIINKDIIKEAIKHGW